MRYVFGLALCSLLGLGTLPALAQDSMSKEHMTTDHAMMAKHKMKKDSMSSHAMKKDSMSKDGKMEK